MVTWINANQGLMLVLLTGVYVAATIVMAARMTKANGLSQKSIQAAMNMATHMEKANRIARAQMDQAAMLQQQRTRPYVVFDLESRGHFMHAVLRNVGQTPAFDVRVETTPALRNSAMNAGIVAHD